MNQHLIVEDYLKNTLILKFILSLHNYLFEENIDF